MSLEKVIEKRLKDAGLNGKKEGNQIPFFVIGEHTNNSLCVDVFGKLKDKLMDKTIECVREPIRIKDTIYTLHGVTGKKTLRVAGKPFHKHSMDFIFNFEKVEEA